MKTSLFSAGRCLVALSALALPASLNAAALNLDWNTLNWTSGSLTQSFDIDPANPGNDVTISFLGDIARISQPISSTTLITGGVSPSNRTLQIVTDYASNQESVQVAIDFHYLAGVSDVSFLLHDIDGSLASWQEEVRGISATGDTLPNFAPTGIVRLGATPTFQITGAGLAQRLTATAEVSDFENGGSASVSFGGNLVRTTSFTFGAATTGNFDPIQSGIALGTVSFTPNAVPEPTVAGLLMLSALALASRRRNR